MVPIPRMHLELSLINPYNALRDSPGAALELLTTLKSFMEDKNQTITDKTQSFLLLGIEPNSHYQIKRKT